MTDEETFMSDVKNDDGGASFTEYDITASPNDFNVLTISSYLEHGSIVIPSIQRFFTWDLQRSSKFIESLILGLPVPQIFLFEESRNKFLILDGQQRLMSIYFFTKMRFPRAGVRALIRNEYQRHNKLSDELLQGSAHFTEFRLKLPKRDDGSRSPLDGLNYAGLGEYKTRFDLTPIRVVIIKQNEPRDDNSSIKEIYNRLNTGGVNLRPQEMRANLYESDFYSLLYRLNQDPIWREILAIPDEDDYMRDVELLLRSFALLVNGPSYQPPMVRFLDSFSGFAKRTLHGEKLLRAERLFRSFLTAAKELPAGSFSLGDTKRFPIALFESVLYGTVRSLWESDTEAAIHIPLEKLQRLAREIVPFLQEGTTKQANVAGRLALAKNIFSIA